MRITDHPRYNTYTHMMERCYSTNSPEYQGWGARGISVCPEWHDSKVFLEYLDNVLGERPDGYTFDRIDNDGNYEPGNVRWASRSEQNANRRHYLQQNHKLSSTGVKWVYKMHNTDKYYGKFQVKRKPFYTTLYDTIDEAHTAVLELREQVMNHHP